MLQNWLEVVPATEQTIVLNERTTFNTDVLRSQIWYRGDSEELFQFFHQLQMSGVNSSFWGSVPTNEKIRKIHSGLPAIIADTLSFMVCSDFDGAKISDTKAQNIFDEQTQQFASVLSKAITDALVDGDGAFKLSVDSEISDKPILEFVGADRVEYCYTRGILNEVIFRTPIKDKSRTLFFEEHYGRGYIESVLLDSNGIEQAQTLPQLEGIPRRAEFDGDYIMAIPLKFYASKKYPNRGKSIFDGGKSDCFDALDEVISQWWDAIRAGRVSKYIPESMIPRDPETGGLKRVNSFGTEFITIDSPLSESADRPKIEVVQPDIKYEAFVNGYSNCLLMCLQGLVSPATLGIDVGKMSSAESQREKKDVTGNTRNTITSTLENVLPIVINAYFKTLDNMNGSEVKDYDATVSFGEYGAPDFDSRVETVGKASTYGIMSVQTQVEELWGSSKEDDWKADEVKRIMQEKGLTEMSEPMVGDELA